MPLFLKNLIATLLLAFMGQSCGLRSTEPSLTVENVENQIRNQIPAQAQVSQVINFIEMLKRTNKIDYSGPWTDSSGSDFRSPKLDGKRDSIKSHIVAMIRDVKRGGLTTWDIQLHFYFDANDKLVEHTVRYVGTSM